MVSRCFKSNFTVNFILSNFKTIKYTMYEFIK